MSGETTRSVALKSAAARLAAAGLEAPARDARALLLAAASLRPVDLTLDPDAPLDAASAVRLDGFIARRLAREPVTRIVGERGFWTLDLLVAPDVLDPRADTETLIETALSLFGHRRAESLRILDLGSGSGALLCALLAEFENAFGVAVDLSPAACAASKANLAHCGLAARAAVLRGDWARAIEARFDLVVSNPPYIPAADIASLDPEVRLHDPALALDGGADGLDCYRAIAREAPRLMRAKGAVILEAGAGQAADIAEFLAAAGLEIAMVRDDLGGHARAVAGRKP